MFGRTFGPDADDPAGAGWPSDEATVCRAAAAAAAATVAIGKALGTPGGGCCAIIDDTMPRAAIAVGLGGSGWMDGWMARGRAEDGGSLHLMAAAAGTGCRRAGAFCC